MIDSKLWRIARRTSRLQIIIDRKVEEYLSVFQRRCIEGEVVRSLDVFYHCRAPSISAIRVGARTGKLAEGLPRWCWRGEPPVTIDEWQVPSLWDAVRHKVDATPEKRRFI